VAEDVQGPGPIEERFPLKLPRSQAHPEALGRGMKMRSISKEIIGDIAEGMGDASLMGKYGLSHDQLRGVFRLLANARKRRISAIVQDIACGMSGPDLIKKYGLSADGFISVLHRLFSENIIRQTEFDNLRSVSGEGARRQEGRAQVRSYPIPMVALCQAGNPRRQYVLRDITEKGLGVEGIEATPNEIKQLMVLGDEMGEIAPFELEAECRWAGPVDENRAMCAGFLIRRISQEDLGRLRELVRGFTFGVDM
jgi:Mor family transcriptional regulator